MFINVNCILRKLAIIVCVALAISVMISAESLIASARNSRV